ncbi:energy-coupling factor ABC transporter ATP-binding protein [Bacillus sp. 2205SS5-2]|uniref:energy-coupling factor ABC transporter ATP-binding protein n=1 Tax=Bacillus sp. 2205SS5-2 TaxID=3109031 RepID=UPI0030049142
MDIKLQQVSYKYAQGTPFERQALYDVSLHIPSREYIAIIGHTGSGKSTLLQHLNALLQPTSGEVQIGDLVVRSSKKAKNLKSIRQQVGIVFQFPEHQLFEETVLKDVMYGPLNFGVSTGEAEERARKYIEQVGLPQEIIDKSPFDLSGGQMRRVAIAGVLAMQPSVLVLDEPTAGLDPKGRKEIMNMFSRLHQEEGLTTILVTHSMEDAAKYANRLMIMHNGRLAEQGSPREIFSNGPKLSSLGLDVPEVVRFQRHVERKLGKKLAKICLTVEELATELMQLSVDGDEL